MKSSSKTCLLLIAVQLVCACSQHLQELTKRSPHSFFGMRGKKLFEENDLYKRKPQFFVGVKGKKLSDELIDYYYKRAPMGFIGMRGKKQFDENLNDNTLQQFPNKGSLIGQIDYTVNDNEDFPVLDLLRTYLQDRASDTPNEIEKRAASYKNFYGVRGKKIQNGGLTVRGKFIGVRGKKDAENADAFAPEYEHERFKRMPQRFIAVRGKKSVPEAESQDGFVN